jgi:uncharacterized membrane protein
VDSQAVAVQAAAEVQVEAGKFTTGEKAQIMEAIAKAESVTSGEIRVHASYSQSESDFLGAAKTQFDRLKMSETKERNAILLYVNPILKKFALYGDQGIHEKVGQAFWESLAKEITHAIRERNRTHGMVHAILKMGDALTAHFPEQVGKKNELSNDPTESE